MGCAFGSADGPRRRGTRQLLAAGTGCRPSLSFRRRLDRSEGAQRVFGISNDTVPISINTCSLRSIHCRRSAKSCGSSLPLTTRTEGRTAKVTISEGRTLGTRATLTRTSCLAPPLCEMSTTKGSPVRSGRKLAIWYVAWPSGSGSVGRGFAETFLGGVGVISLVRNFPAPGQQKHHLWANAGSATAAGAVFRAAAPSK